MFPDWVEIQVPLGGIYLAAGDTEKAWDFYDKLAIRVPHSAEAHYYRGAALGYRGRREEAVKEFRLSRKLDPNYSYPYYDEAGTLWEMGQREQAVQVLQQWVDLHPNDSEALARLQDMRARMNTGGGAPLGIPPAVRPH
jgi:tetratricopeptide (TPR) repeat protein